MSPLYYTLPIAISGVDSIPPPLGEIPGPTVALIIIPLEHPQEEEDPT